MDFNLSGRRFRRRIIPEVRRKQATLTKPSPPVLVDEADHVEIPSGGSKLRQSEETIRRLLILIILYTKPASIVMRPGVDADIWWHLRTGQWIVEHSAVPATDPFSSFGQGKPWLAYSWLFEVMTYGLYQGLGLTGIILFRVVIVFAVAVAIHRFVVKREPRFVVGTGLVGLALIPIGYLMSERPWLFTVLFFTLTLDAVLDLRAGRSKRTIWLLPLLYAFWANLHIQFIHGLFVLVLACVCPLVDRFFGLGEAAEPAARERSRAWWQLVVLTIVCFLATLLNPYHLRLYGVVVQYVTQPGAYDCVLEHLGMDFREPWNWALLALTLAATFALGRRRRVSSFEGSLLIAAAYFSFHSRRDLWFMVLTALAILTSRSPSTEILAEGFPLTGRRAVVLAAGIFLVLAACFWSRGLSVQRIEKAVRDTYPEDAAAFVERKGCEGPLFNHFDWGGYLIWRLPKLPVAMDGRTNLHGDQRMLRSFRTWEGQRGWDSDPELEAARLVIGQSQCALVSLLRHDPRFELVYEDPVATVFVARSD
jgi:hypothetical protein